MPKYHLNSKGKYASCYATLRACRYTTHVANIPNEERKAVLVPATVEEVERKYREKYASEFRAEARAKLTKTSIKIKPVIVDHDADEPDYKLLNKLSPIGVFEYIDKFPESSIRWPLIRRMTFTSYDFAMLESVRSAFDDKDISFRVTERGLNISPSSKEQLRVVIEKEMQSIISNARFGAYLDDKKIKHPLKDALRRIPKPTPNQSIFDNRLDTLKIRAKRSGINLY